MQMETASQPSLLGASKLQGSPAAAGSVFLQLGKKATIATTNTAGKNRCVEIKWGSFVGVGARLQAGPASRR